MAHYFQALGLAFPLTQTLSQCTSSVSMENILYNQPFTAAFTAASGYTLTGVTPAITMSGVAVSNAWTLNADGTITISIAFVTGAIAITVSAIQSASVTGVVGFTGLTNDASPTPDLVFTDDISGVSKYTTETVGTKVIVHNALDDYFPFCDIAEMTDGDGNVFVKYPKMWIKWVLDGSGNIDGIKISDVKADDDYFIPDAFLDPTDTNNYLDYFALGKYEASGSESKMYSKSGQACYVNMNRAVARTAARSYGTAANAYNGYQQIDLSMLTLYNFLCMMYYKTPNIQTVFLGRTGESSAANTGSCDNVTGLNGWDLITDCVKMLGIENPYGNIDKWIDGVYFATGTIYAHRLPQQYADSTANGSPLGFSRATSGGRVYVSKLKKGTSDATRSYAYCSETYGYATRYFGDSYIYSTSGVCLCAGGEWNTSSGAGLWCLCGNFSASSAFSYLGGRLAYRPL